MDNFFSTLKQLGPSKLGIMGGVFMVLIMFFVFVTVRISSPELKLLYGDLSALDARTISIRLQEENISYDVSPDGSQILVAENQVQRARMILAAEGLPQGGNMGYEIFDKQSKFGSTNFIQNMNQVRALEGELSRTIGSLQQIKTARVHLVLPQRKLFSRDPQPSSGSVFIGMQPGATLKPEQVMSIQFLVASAVPDLEAETISVIDGEGNLLARGGEGSENMMTLKAEELRRSYEKRLTQSIEDIVGRVVGYSRVRANVTAELNFDRISTNEELYDPEGQVVRSTQTVEENSLERGNAAGGAVSVEQNLPGVTDALGDGGVAPTQEGGRLEEVTNFEISRTIRNVTREVGEIRKLSIAVLVDGTYETIPAADEDSEPIRQYTPRSQEELDKIAALVQSAVGFDADRGDTVEVINMQFVNIDTGGEIPAAELLFGFERDDILKTVEIIAVVVMIILIVLLIVQPMINRILSADKTPNMNDGYETELLTGGGATAALEGPKTGGGGAISVSGQNNNEEDDLEIMMDMDDVEGKVKKSSVRKVENIVENYPTETVSVIRSWMTSD